MACNLQASWSFAVHKLSLIKLAVTASFGQSCKQGTMVRNPSASFPVQSSSQLLITLSGPEAMSVLPTLPYIWFCHWFVSSQEWNAFTTLWRQSKRRLQSVMICCWTIVLLDYLFCRHEQNSIDPLDGCATGHSFRDSPRIQTFSYSPKVSTVLAIHPEYRLEFHLEFQHCELAVTLACYFAWRTQTLVFKLN